MCKTYLPPQSTMPFLNARGVLLRMLFVSLSFNSGRIVEAVSLRRRPQMFGEDPLAPPKTTDYMHPWTLREVKSRTSQHAYHRRVNSINQDSEPSQYRSNGSRFLGYRLSTNQSTDRSKYTPLINHVYSRKIKKDSEEPAPRQKSYNLRSKDVRVDRKKVNYTEGDDLVALSEKSKVGKTSKERSRDKYKQFRRERSERIKNGTASNYDMEQYNKHIAQMRLYRQNNREKFNESSRRSREKRKDRLLAEKE